MAPRLELQAILVNLLGSSNVYFEPPASLNMQYDCIVYKRDRINTLFANNHPYKNRKRYQITVITRDPDSEIPDKVGALPLCSYDRYFAVDDLNHDVYNLFF